MERRLKTPDLFKFPYFEAICWYVAQNLLETLKGESDVNVFGRENTPYQMYGESSKLCTSDLSG